MSSCPCPPTPPPLITKKPVMRNMLATQIRGLLVPGTVLTLGAVFVMYMVNNRPKHAAYAEYYRRSDLAGTSQIGGDVEFCYRRSDGRHPTVSCKIATEVYGRQVNDIDEIEADMASKGYFTSVKTDGEEKDKKKK